MHLVPNESRGSDQLRPTMTCTPLIVINRLKKKTIYNNIILMDFSADSVTWNPHKLMGALLQCSTIHFKEEVKAYLNKFFYT